MIILIQNFNLMNDIFTQKSISIVEVLEKGEKKRKEIQILIWFAIKLVKNYL